VARSPPVRVRLASGTDPPFRHGLPLLFSGEPQKEFFVNSALGLCDALLHPFVESEAATPPADPAEGDCWLVGAAATGALEGQTDSLAYRQASQWCFAEPREGMRIFDRSTGQYLVHIGRWRREGAVPVPSAGQTVDSEARAAIALLIAALARQGILPEE
jgi:hypothetical protein